MKDTFLLQEVIDDLVNTDKSLSAALMKLNYFGKLIKNQELITYTNNELNGYKPDDDIPEYRKTIATLSIDIQTGPGNNYTVQLPISMLDDPYRHDLKFISVTEGIAAIEKLSREVEKGDSEDQVAIPLPIEKLHILQKPARKLYKSPMRVDVVAARMLGNSNIVVEVPNAIRTKLLDFVMSLAETFGHNIGLETFKSKGDINNQTIIHQMNTTINNSGDGNVINTGNKNQIHNEANIYKGNSERLKKELKKQGIDEDDISEVLEIVTKEKPKENGLLGENANSWISKIINKTLNGIGKISTGVSANMLATLIKEYYGFLG